MRRQEFIRLLGGTAAFSAFWPLTVLGQQPSRIPRVGVFVAGEENDRDMQARLVGLQQGLERLGWSDGRNIRMDYRYGDGKPDRFQPLAKELIALQPDVIVAQTPPVVAAVRRETSVIPTVFVDVSDAIGPGFIANLARPGGNLTGMLSFETGVIGKWLAMLKEIAPAIAHVGLMGNPQTTSFDYFQRAAVAQAPSLGIKVEPYRVESTANIESAIESLGHGPNGGLMILPDTTTILHRDLVIASVDRHRLPAVYPFRFFVTAGGLMSYSIDFAYSYRLAASSIDRILRGAKPADIPVQAPTKFETVLNLKTAKALGLSVPPGLLVAADEVIE
jgi:putative ABC transport system substrate-binding protein